MLTAYVRVSWTKILAIMTSNLTSFLSKKLCKKSRFLIHQPQLKEKVGLKVRKMEKTKREKINMFSIRKIVAQDIGQFNKIGNIIGFWKYIINTLFAKK